MFYAPGCLCVVDRAAAEQFEATLGPAEPAVPFPGRGAGEGWGERNGWGARLWRRAEQAAAQALEQRQAPFRPECLTLYMNNECTLRCTYCHSDPSPKSAPRLRLSEIAAAAEGVAESCRQMGRPFYQVFHGGGEPTLHRHQVERALEALEAVARTHGVETMRYVATNGIMSEEKARWLTRRFDLIGLSCDGPADIQNGQRPRCDGGATSNTVERTAHVLREEGAHFHVRTTLTATSLCRQAEIAGYVCQELAPEEIHFEPVYAGGRTSAVTGLTDNRAEEFAAHFLRARAVAQGYGVPLLISGSRLNTVHGPYCHVFRGVLNIVPGGVATACFKLSQARQVMVKRAAIGAWERKTGRYEIDQRRVQALRRLVDQAWPDCDGCFNRYHCVRSCPDRCPLDGNTTAAQAGSPQILAAGFRCRAQHALSSGMLQETADRLWSEVMSGKAQSPHGTESL